MQKRTVQKRRREDKKKKRERERSYYGLLVIIQFGAIFFVFYSFFGNFHFRAGHRLWVKTNDSFGLEKKRGRQFCSLAPEHKKTCRNKCQLLIVFRGKDFSQRGYGSVTCRVKRETDKSVENPTPARLFYFFLICSFEADSWRTTRGSVVTESQYVLRALHAWRLRLKYVCTYAPFVGYTVTNVQGTCMTSN